MSDEWVTADEALRRVSAVTDPSRARRLILSRATSGDLDAMAARLIWAGETQEGVDIPWAFWSYTGETEMTQDWEVGIFETYIDRTDPGGEGSDLVRAYGVLFARSGVDALLSSIRDTLAPPTAPVGGRPPASWWDELWVEICRQLWHGELEPKKQADIESAMSSWASSHGHSPADSTIRTRARRLWLALNKREAE